MTVVLIQTNGLKFALPINRVRNHRSGKEYGLN